MKPKRDPRDFVQIKITVPKSLGRKLWSEAKRKRVSVTREIVDRLTFELEWRKPYDDLARCIQTLRALREKTAPREERGQ